MKKYIKYGILMVVSIIFCVGIVENNTITIKAKNQIQNYTEYKMEEDKNEKPKKEKNHTFPMKKKFLKANKIYSVDLDGDKKKEKIQIKKRKGIDRYYYQYLDIYINKKLIKRVKVNGYFSQKNNVAIVDLNKKDKRKEILICLCSENGCIEHFDFYHLKKKKGKLVSLLGKKDGISRIPKRMRQDKKGNFSFYADFYNETLGCFYMKWNFQMKRDKISVKNNKTFLLDQSVYHGEASKMYGNKFMSLRKDVEAYKDAGGKTKIGLLTSRTRILPKVIKFTRKHSFKGKQIYVQVKPQNGEYKGRLLWIKVPANKRLFEITPSWG